MRAGRGQPDLSLFRSDWTGTVVLALVLTRFPGANQGPVRNKCGAGFGKRPQQADSEKVIAAVEPAVGFLEPITI